MALQKREKTMLMFLGGVVVVAVLFQVLTGGKSKAGKEAALIAKKTAGQITGAVAGLAKPESVGKRPADAANTQYSAWSARDPFSRPEFEIQRGKAGQGGSPLTVKGIVWMRGSPYVLINDVILTVGEEKKGIRVDRIEGRKVFCRKGGKMFTLLWSESP
jgi:hypothetical protein